MIPVILAGGSGARLWPLSRERCPKQFIDLWSGRSMFQETLLRLEGLPAAEPVIVCNENHRFLVAEQCRQVDVRPASIFLEPVARNTAPALALVALNLVEQGQLEPLLMLPADHRIRQPEKFREAVMLAERQALQGAMVTFGVVPSRAETGYGYIQMGAARDVGFDVAAFVEKPGQKNAERFVESGDYLWNSGIFMFQPEVFLDELQRYSPKIVIACHEALRNIRHDLDFTRIDGEAFAACPADSIDYAVMEKTASACVVPMNADWNDMGSWSSLREAEEADSEGNIVKGDVILEQCSNSFISGNNRLVAAVGVSDLVLVDTDDAVLVADGQHLQDVKAIVAQLKEQGRGELDHQGETYRPWGSYVQLAAGAGFQIRRLRIQPGASLSRHRHSFRAEHWAVTRGKARVTIEGEEHKLAINDSLHAPAGVEHQLSNGSQGVLEVIEIQTGGFLSEEDIQHS